MLENDMTIAPAPTQGDVLTQATPEQVEFYRTQGYLKFGRIFSEDEIGILHTHVDEMIAGLPDGKRPEEMDTPHFSDPWLFRYLAHPRILDVVEDFIGPDIVLWSSHFIAKPGGNGRAVPWHTDGAFWQSSLEPMDVITLWLAVDPSRTENGCMRVVPGSHRAPRVALDAYQSADKQANVFGNELTADQIDLEKTVDLELWPGECHFHDSWTVHGSSPNTSPNRRCGYTMRYMPASVVHHAEGWSKDHQIYLLRGQDRTGGRNHYTPVPTV
jgi:chlorinating enzyme